ncbi:hypothetical protein M433DRAFT_60989 [Acidomyces richmondensis BFW]|nr:hypothetical protein M433DRAFT_60989 [Acidomyces richmondensis BFW]
MNVLFVAATAALGSSLLAQASISDLIKRQNNANSTCSVYGVDFQNGGSYFINSGSSGDFTAVSEFEGCNNESASVLLVNLQTLDEYECSAVHPTPDNTPEISTCEVQKSDMSSGNWSLLVIGNNGDGKPYAYQRDFYLTVTTQHTVTSTVTGAFTQTIQPTYTITSKTYMTTTSSIPNSATITSDSIDNVTITPSPTISEASSTITDTFTKWQQKQVTRTYYVTPSCTVPRRQQDPDPRLRYHPTKVIIPDGIASHDVKRSNRKNQRKAQKYLKEHHTFTARKPISKRAPDPPTLTITKTVAGNVTTTYTASPITITSLELKTITSITTLPPKTTYLTEKNTVTDPIPTKITKQQLHYVVKYITETMYIEWVETKSTIPSALETSCIRNGGHFGDAW